MEDIKKQHPENYKNYRIFFHFSVDPDEEVEGDDIEFGWYVHNLFDSAGKP